MKITAKYPLVSLYGSNFINNGWTEPCMKSWKNIVNISPSEFFVLLDKSIESKEADTLSNMGFQLLGDEQEVLVDDFLTFYPSLQLIRKKDLTWRKIIDVAILFKDAHKVTIIDTDVYIKDRVFLPLENCDVAYMREDIPAYRGKWTMVWQEKMVPALNAGIIIVNPKIIDFDYLERLVKKYFIDCKSLWWTEQSAWSCLAGKSYKRLLFSGKQVRVTSGTRKRSAAEITSNSYQYFGKKGMITNFKEFQPLLAGGSIFHFAGPGKYMFEKSRQFLNASVEESIVNIEGENEETLSFLDKVWISFRLFLKEAV